MVLSLFIFEIVDYWTHIFNGFDSYFYIWVVWWHLADSTESSTCLFWILEVKFSIFVNDIIIQIETITNLFTPKSLPDKTVVIFLYFFFGQLIVLLINQEVNRSNE